MFDPKSAYFRIFQQIKKFRNSYSCRKNHAQKTAFDFDLRQAGMCCLAEEKATCRGTGADLSGFCACCVGIEASWLMNQVGPLALLMLIREWFSIPYHSLLQKGFLITALLQSRPPSRIRFCQISVGMQMLQPLL